MNYIKRKLYILYFIIVATFMLTFYFVLPNIVESKIEEQEIKRLDDDMISLTAYMDEHVQNNEINEAETEETIRILEAIGTSVNERVTLLAESGKAVYESTTE